MVPGSRPGRSTPVEERLSRRLAIKPGIARRHELLCRAPGPGIVAWPRRLARRKAADDLPHSCMSGTGFIIKCMPMTCSSRVSSPAAKERDRDRRVLVASTAPFFRCRSISAKIFFFSCHHQTGATPAQLLPCPSAPPRADVAQLHGEPRCAATWAMPLPIWPVRR